MPITLDNPSRKLNERRIPSNHPIPRKRETREAAHHLTKLLTSAPVDLSGISDEIRRHPDLETLILRSDALVTPSLDEPPNTIEEAVVVLGTSRLRTLIDAWSSTSPIDLAMLQTERAQP